MFKFVNSIFVSIGFNRMHISAFNSPASHLNENVKDSSPHQMDPSSQVADREEKGFPFKFPKTLKEVIIHLLFMKPSS